jgi:uncharacterized membrane protein YfcA
MGILEIITQNALAIIALIGTGAFAGFLAGLLGVGGGIVIVPVLFFLFQSFGVSSQSAMSVATATSLATIIPTSISSILSHHKKGNVDFQILSRWAVFIIFGVLFGSMLVTRIHGIWLTTLFGIIAILSAMNMLFSKGKSLRSYPLPGKAGQIVISSSIGFFSAMVGIGGGTLSVPLLTRFNYPTHKSVGTASAIGFLISFPGAIILLIFGNTPQDAPFGSLVLVNLPGFFLIVPLTILFAPVGVSLASKLDAVKLKKVFSVVLLITGLRMLAQVLL